MRTDSINQKWYLHPNDLIGGFSINNVDKPLSQCDFRKDEGEIADFMMEEDAKHIVELHNEWLATREKSKKFFEQLSGG